MRAALILTMSLAVHAALLVFVRPDITSAPAHMREALNLEWYEAPPPDAADRTTEVGRAGAASDEEPQRSTRRRPRQRSPSSPEAVSADVPAPPDTPIEDVSRSEDRPEEAHPLLVDDPFGTLTFAPDPLRDSGAVRRFAQTGLRAPATRFGEVDRPVVRERETLFTLAEFIRRAHRRIHDEWSAFLDSLEPHAPGAVHGDRRMCRVLFRVNGNGMLVENRILLSSGDHVFDTAALAAIAAVRRQQ